MLKVCKVCSKESEHKSWKSTTCNSSKQNKDMIQWYTDQIFYNKNRLEAILKFIRTRR